MKLEKPSLRFSFTTDHARSAREGSVFSLVCINLSRGSPSNDALEEKERGAQWEGGPVGRRPSGKEAQWEGGGQRWGGAPWLVHTRLKAKCIVLCSGPKGLAMVQIKFSSPLT